MKRTIRTALASATIALFATPSHANIFDDIFGHRPAPVSRHHAAHHAQRPARPIEGGHVGAMISSAVASRIGARWIPTALRIASIESGMRCGASNGRALGVFQVTDPARFGFSRSSALTCAGGIAAGVEHMAMCIGKGATDARHMFVCHNAGTPFARHVESAYRFALRN